MKTKTTKRARLAALLVFLSTTLLSSHVAGETYCFSEGSPSFDNPWDNIKILLAVDDSPTILEGMGLRVESYSIRSGFAINMAGDRVPLMGSVVEGFDKAGEQAWIVTITGTLAQFSQPWLDGIPYYLTTRSLVIPKDKLGQYGTPDDPLSAVGTIYIGNILINKSLFPGGGDDFFRDGKPFWRMRCSDPPSW
jgi:hypothetical protein